MSNLSDAIEHLEDAEDLVDTEAEIDDSKSTALLAMVDQIRQCKHDLEELEKKQEYWEKELKKMDEKEKK